MAEQKGRTKMGEEKAGGAARGCSEEWLSPEAMAAAIRAGDDPLAVLRIAMRLARKDAFEEAAHVADVARGECEALWKENGGMTGTPDWIAAVPMDEWQRQCWRYSGSGGADAADSIAIDIRKLASTASAPKEPPDPPEGPEAQRG